MEMKKKDLLDHKKIYHWCLPKSPWLSYQQWWNVFFIHWPIPSQYIIPFLPKGLDLDTYNGCAWISLVFFQMNTICFRYLPIKPFSLDFNEVNIRTYVKKKNKQGVYFFRLDVSTVYSAFMMKNLSIFPYRYIPSRLDGENLRMGKPNQEIISVKSRVITDFHNKTDFDRWITERYIAYLGYKNKIYAYELHHVEWELSKLDLLSLKIAYQDLLPEKMANHLAISDPQKSHYSKGVDVIAWNKVPCDSGRLREQNKNTMNKMNSQFFLG